ncbi:MAG: ribosomal RNA small subunit methyltransferase A [Elusimicrobia bacterium RIFOXYC2_FULL_34_12]|nr:MAG: ribosomal RNA small subunit methyltransferase A [Elusimicrobia bacterium RIFOXYC2_FULL_34_12]
MSTPFGQNFLIDKNITRKIVKSADINPSDTIVEIGPGKGILTEEIAKSARKIIAIEIDNLLFENLTEKFKSNQNIKIIKKDFLKWTPPKIKKMKFIANLPYYVSTSIIEKVLHLDNWDTAIFMVQKEVANRIRADVCSEDYSSLSILCKVYCKIKKLFDVTNKCFFPVPKVTSTVIGFNRLIKPLVEKKNEKIFFKVVRASFRHRRKTILNSLFIELDIKKDILREKLLLSGINPCYRAENISIDEFIKLSNVI